MDSISTLSKLIDPSGKAQFYISFIITPIASNASELISSLIFARKKKRTITSVSMSALLGAATMVALWTGAFSACFFAPACDIVLL